MLNTYYLFVMYVFLSTLSPMGCKLYNYSENELKMAAILKFSNEISGFNLSKKLNHLEL